MRRTLFHNGTVISLDSHDTIGTCLLVDGNVVQGVFGSPADCGEAEDATMVDLEGKAVIPGFNDNHIHMNFLGDSLEALHFHGKSEPEIVALLKERFAGIGRKTVVLGYEWDYPACKDPRKELLDEAFPHNPVILGQYGGHNLWVNSAALRKMGIGRKTPDPPEGIICRDEDGEPTGLLKDINNWYLNAWFIGRLLSLGENRANYLRAIGECSSLGITSAQDNTWSFIAMIVVSRLFRQGKLSVRLSCWPHGESVLFRLLFDMQGFNRRWYSRGPVKYFIDGTFSGRTAWLKEPYPGEPDNHGIGRTRGQVKGMLRRHVGGHRQCAFHAIGDGAVSAFLDALEELSAEFPDIPAMRLRLEHAQLVSPEDIPRIKRLGVLVCAQPSALNNPGKDRAILGEERAKRAYPYRTLLDSGVHLSFGSDAPGESSHNPFVGIHQAVNREGPERISVLEALRCYTTGSAYAEFREGEKGSLAPGMVADFLVLSDNPLAIEEGRIKDIRVEKTFVDGVMVYEAR